MGRIVEHADIGEDDRVRAEFGGVVDGAPPGLDVAGAGKGVHGDKHASPARMGVGDAVAHLLKIEIQAGIVARIGAIAKAAIDGVGARLDRRPQRRGGASGTDQLEIGRGSHAACPSP